MSITLVHNRVKAGLEVELLIETNSYEINSTPYIPGTPRAP